MFVEARNAELADLAVQRVDEDVPCLRRKDTRDFEEQRAPLCQPFVADALREKEIGVPAGGREFASIRSWESDSGPVTLRT